MALQIKKQKDGKTANYFRIVKLWFNADEKDMEVELRGYANKKDSDDAKTGAKTLQLTYKFTLSGVDFPNTDKANWMKDVYGFIKLSDLYEGWGNATDA